FNLIGNLLNRFSCRLQKDCAQARMTINKRLKCAPKRLNIQVGRDSDRPGDVVGGTVWRNLMYEPKGPLAIRKRVCRWLARSAPGQERRCPDRCFLNVSYGQAVE